MIIRAIIEKIRKDLRAEHPEATPEEIEIVAMEVYREYQRILLTGDGDHTHFSGIYSYPKKVTK